MQLKYGTKTFQLVQQVKGTVDSALRVVLNATGLADLTACPFWEPVHNHCVAGIKLLTRFLIRSERYETQIDQSFHIIWVAKSFCFRCWGGLAKTGMKTSTKTTMRCHRKRNDRDNTREGCCENNSSSHHKKTKNIPPPPHTVIECERQSLRLEVCAAVPGRGV